MSKQAFIQFKADIVKGLNASVEWQKSKASGSADAFIKSDASSVIEDEHFIQYGLYYTPFIEAGRPKNTTNSGGLVQGIYDWLQYKKYDISFDNDKQRLSRAKGIATKTAKFGSFKFRENKQTQIFETIINSAKPSLLQALAQGQKAKYSSEVQEEIKRINNLDR